MIQPIRIQRNRQFKNISPNELETVYCGRPTKWGNPIRLIKDHIYIDASYRRKIFDPWVYYNVGDISDVIHLYMKLWDGTKFQNKDLQYWAYKFQELDLSELKGKNISCWCKDEIACHCDVLLKLANR